MDYTTRDIKPAGTEPTPPVVASSGRTAHRRSTAMQLAISASPTGIDADALVARAERIDAFLAGGGNTDTVAQK